MKKVGQQGFSAIEVVLVVVALVATGVAGYFAYQGMQRQPASPAPSITPSTTPVVQNGEVRLRGAITRDDCFIGGRAGEPPLGDVGCSITVGGYDIPVKVGNIRPPENPGTVTGLDFNRSQVGSQAEVYAKVTGAQTASIWTDSKYYVHITK